MSACCVFAEVAEIGAHTQEHAGMQSLGQKHAEMHVSRGGNALLLAFPSSKNKMQKKNAEMHLVVFFA